MEIRAKIKEVVNTLPETVLSDVLHYVQQKAKEPVKIRLSVYLPTFVAKYDNLLKRLA
jgi:hypothetical protein